MKVSREQVAENRRRILDAAAQLFRQRGFENVTVAEVMSAAGLTHGGFYGHFDSKDALIDAAIAHETHPQRVSLANPGRYADSYLSRQHRDNITCPFSALLGGRSLGCGNHRVDLPAQGLGHGVSHGS